MAAARKVKWEEVEDAVLPFSEKIIEFKKSGINRTSNAVSAWIHTDDHLTVANYYYCHASMNGNYHQHPDAPDPKALLSQVQKEVVDIAHVRTFYEWLFNFSPFSPAFISRDGEATIKRGVVVVDPNHPSNMVGGALIATRFGTERYQLTNKVAGRCLIWNRLVDLGVHPSLAFTLACGMYLGEVDSTEKITKINQIYFNPDHCSGHIPLQVGRMGYIIGPGDTSASDIDGRIVHHNFFHGVMPGADNKTFKNRKATAGSSYLWTGKEKKPTIKYDVNQVVLDILQRELKGLKPKSTNPFGRALIVNAGKPASDRCFDFEPAMEIIAKLSPDIVKEL